MNSKHFPLTIDRQSPVPMYYQLSQGIINLIQSGELTHEERLPSENEFASMYGIVPMTVRQAMNELVNDGYIYRVRGKGTFVAPRNLEHTLDRLVSFSEDMQARKMTAGSKILVFKNQPAPELVARKLRIETGSKVIYTRRLRLANNEPVGLHDTYISGVTISKAELEERGSLYAVLANKEVVLTEGDDVIEALVADTQLGSLLKVRPGVALLRVLRTSYASTGQPVEYVEATYRADFYRYAIHLKR